MGVPKNAGWFIEGKILLNNTDDNWGWPLCLRTPPFGHFGIIGYGGSFSISKIMRVYTFGTCVDLIPPGFFGVLIIELDDGNIETGKPNQFDGKNPWVSGEDVPNKTNPVIWSLTQSISQWKKIQALGRLSRLGRLRVRRTNPAAPFCELQRLGLGPFVACGGLGGLGAWDSVLFQAKFIWGVSLSLSIFNQQVDELMSKKDIKNPNYDGIHIATGPKLSISTCQIAGYVAVCSADRSQMFPNNSSEHEKPWFWGPIWDAKEGFLGSFWDVWVKCIAIFWDAYLCQYFWRLPSGELT